jgi:hypothetical protein
MTKPVQNPTYTGEAFVTSYSPLGRLVEVDEDAKGMTFIWTWDALAAPPLVPYTPTRRERLRGWRDAWRTRIARWIAPWLSEEWL